PLPCQHIYTLFPYTTLFRSLYKLWQSVVADMPREDVYTPISYEQWKALTFGTPRLLPEGYIIAKHGSEYVGLSFVFRNEKQPQRSEEHTSELQSPDHLVCRL